MKEEDLKNYFSNISQIGYRFNSIELRIVNLISCMSILFGFSSQIVVNKTQCIPKYGVFYKNEEILLEVIFGDTYSITFGDGLVILKPQPNFFSISYLVSHP